MSTHNPTDETLQPAEEHGRDEKADFPGVNTAKDKPEAPIGSAAASAGVGHMTKSATEAQRGTSAQ